MIEKKRLILLNASQVKLADDGKDVLNAEEKFRVWLFKRYLDFKELLVSCLENEDKSSGDSVKIACINSAFELIKCETQLLSETKSEDTENDNEKKTNFPFEFFHVIN